MPISQENIDIHKVSLGQLYNFHKISIGNIVVYSAGNTVTYYVDTDVAYHEEVDADETVLYPSTFIPSKAGWEFIGWRQDTNANASVLNTLNMEDTAITLYAVFRQAVTVTYYNGNNTAQSKTGYKYYNNGNSVNPTFTIAQAAISGWSVRGWSTSTAGNGGITYGSLNNTTITANITLYAMYQQTIYLYCVANGSTSTYSGIRYYNSNGTTVNPAFTVGNPSKSGATFNGWSASSSSTAIANATISNLSLAANTYRYAVFTNNTNTSTLVIGKSDTDGFKKYADGTKYGTIILRGSWLMSTGWSYDSDSRTWEEYASGSLAIDGVTVMGHDTFKYVSGWQDVTNRSFTLPNKASVEIYARTYGNSWTVKQGSYIELVGRTTVG